MIIIGIDPGTTRIGYGVINKEGAKLTYVDSGLLDLPKGTYNERLPGLEKCLRELVDKNKPERIGLERLFFVKNQKTGIRVAEARGVILNFFLTRGLPVFEVTPTEVKLSTTGDGRATKQAVMKMVGLFLDLGLVKMVDDASDALAIAITISNKSLLTQEKS
ncbi:MAG: crossover junction endodeoxyribonuclease RuvC [Patescibacteria group bacterium]